MEDSKGRAPDDAPAPPVRTRRRRRREIQDKLRTEQAIGVRLTASEIADIETQALAIGLSRSAWVRALVRRRTQGRPTFSPAGEQALIGVVMELRRIGVDIRQTLLMMEGAIKGGQGLDRELEALSHLRAEIRGQIAAVAEAFEGNLAFWETPA
jgi:hypothetical protein